MLRMCTYRLRKNVGFLAPNSHETEGKGSAFIDFATALIPLFRVEGKCLTKGEKHGICRMFL